MLGDNSEKSKNPLKKAMRRRNAKTVTFTSPTYIEASDVEYSDEEDLDDQASFHDEDATHGDVDDEDMQNDDIVVEPLRPKSKDKTAEEAEKVEETRELDRSSPEKNRSSQEIFEPEGTSIPSILSEVLSLTEFQWEPPSAGRGTALCATLIRSSKTTQWRPRRSPSPRICSVTKLAAAVC
jgi:hypothetical protein